MEDQKIIRKFPAGTVRIPPSKSYTHRALICAWLASRGANKESTLHNFGLSQDIEATLCGIQALGGRYLQEDASLRMLPVGEAMTAGAVDCAESGSTLRFLLPLAALGGGECVFTGRGRLMDRPLDVYDSVFAQAGVAFRREPGQVFVKGPLVGGDYRLPGDISSQFVSGLLFALPLAQGDSVVRLTTPLESRAYADMTVEVMRRFGVRVETPDKNTYRIPGGQTYRPCTYAVEADYSQAAFFLVAAALGRPLVCAGLNPQSMQGDRAILDILKAAGAQLNWTGDSVAVTAERLRSVVVDAREIPDLTPPVAVLCAFCEGTSRIINAARVRLKESDRISAMASELAALGARVEEGPDSLAVHGAQTLPGGEVDAHNDHRIAMAMAVAAIRCKGSVALTGGSSVNKSYPAFWEDFEKEDAR